ncbi:MAG: inositol monophosphatase [Candidatus Saccharimonadales bacterium]
MDNLESETEFFHEISKRVIRYVKNTNQDISVVVSKGVGDYATQMDIDVEQLIVTELAKQFPNDSILAEESHADTEITDGRIWIIDPICGTNNLGRGTNIFCTNIALADGGKLIASCVIDHSQADYYWSAGNNKINTGHNQYVLAPNNELGLKIDVNFGSAKKSGDKNYQLKHNLFLLRIMEGTNYDMVSLNSSLSNLYTALGKLDGFVDLFNHAWDVCAASFLIQQAGGVITALDGSPWTLTTIGAIAGRTPEIHKQLLDLFVSS